MKLAFKEWVNDKEKFTEAITIQDLKDQVKKAPWLFKMFDTRSWPKDLQQWGHGFINGQQAARAGWNVNENPYKTEVDPEMYNGWMAGYRSIRGVAL